jgi:hypothetical protein
MVVELPHYHPCNRSVNLPLFRHLLMAAARDDQPGNPLYRLSLHGTRIAGYSVYVWIRGRHGQSLVHHENVFDSSTGSTKFGGTRDGIDRHEGTTIIL